MTKFNKVHQNWRQYLVYKFMDNEMIYIDTIGETPIINEYLIDPFTKSQSNTTETAWDFCAEEDHWNTETKTKIADSKHFKL